ncbi:MAG: sugar transferase [Holophagaceae bacterium]|nr:sugar transferase [Holophagaceae bacterium]
MQPMSKQPHQPTINNENLAPIVLFVFARPDHTGTTLRALAANHLASQSDLIVYSDAARNETENIRVNEVRAIVRSTPGFRSIRLIERDSNYGLARNIIEGVTEVCVRHGRAIVMEDDLVTSPQFLTFMNLALERYAGDPRVWHISGWNYPIDPSGLGDAFFLRVMNCWGWATWADRWVHFEKDTDLLLTRFNKKMIRRFDLENSGAFWSQVIGNNKGTINTWAIYWYATIFLNNGLCLNPAQSFISNIGLDGSGTHGSRHHKEYATCSGPDHQVIFPEIVEEAPVAIDRITAFYRQLQPSVARRVIRKAKSLLNVLQGSA